MANTTKIHPYRPVAGTGQNVTFSATHAESAAFGSQTFAVRISALTAACHVRVDRAPVAVATDMLVKQTDPPLDVAVAPGDKISVIQDSTGGTLNIIELTH